jgi:hypothetical protein
MLRSLDPDNPDFSTVRQMKPKSWPLLVLGTSGKAGSRYSDLDPTTRKRLIGVGTVPLQLSSPIALERSAHCPLQGNLAPYYACAKASRSCLS